MCHLIVTTYQTYGGTIVVMDRITATACLFDNRNRDAVVITTTATAVIFFNNRVYFKKFVSKKKFILPILKFEL